MEINKSRGLDPLFTAENAEIAEGFTWTNLGGKKACKEIRMMADKDMLNRITDSVIGAAIRVIECWVQAC